MRIVLTCIIIYIIHKWIHYLISKSNIDLDETLKLDTNANVDTTVVLCGPSNSGKTVLFHRIMNQKAVATVTSIEMNHELLDNNIRLVDYPGHPSLRSNLLELLKNISSELRVILVLDSSKSVARDQSSLRSRL